MGVSTNAIVCYGLRTDWLEYERLPLGPDTWKVQPPDGWAWDAEQEIWVYAEDHEYAGEETNLEDLDTEDVTLLEHCSSSSPCWIVAINGSRIKARRGFPVRLTLPAVKPDWDEKLLAFAKRWGIDLDEDEKPGWILCSWWSTSWWST